MSYEILKVLITLITDPITPGVPSRGSLVRPKNQTVSQVFRLSSEQKVFLDDFTGDLEWVSLKGDKEDDWLLQKLGNT